MEMLPVRGHSKGARNFSLLFRVVLFNFLLISFLLPAICQSAQVTLAWDPNTEPNLARYRLYYGTASRNYSTNLDVGLTTTYTVPNLSDGVTYYFALKAENTEGASSDFSNEVSFINPVPQAALTVSKQGTGTGTVTASGIACGSDCSQAYNIGTAVTLTAAADASSIFAGWGGACSGTNASCTVTMDAAKTVTATFTLKTFTITASAGTGGTISPLGATTVAYGASQSYAITPSSGYRVSGVTVDNSSAGALTSYTFSNVTANHSISATFTNITYTLTVSKNGTGTGSVTTNPAGTSFNAGTTVILTATADGSSIFAGWGGACSGTNASCTVTMDAAKTVTATFTLKTFTITASAGPGGSISPAGASAVVYGGSKSYTITPSPGYSLANVSVDGASAGIATSYTFTNVTADHVISASFEATTYSLTILKSGNGNGSVVNNMSGASLNAGSTVSLTALPEADSIFGGWSGACTGTSPTCTVTMDGNKTVTAAFILKTAKPVSTITSPVDRESIAQTSYTILGSALDRSGAGLQKVEVSTDGGQTWGIASGSASWSFKWDIPGTGTYVLKSKATDNLGNVEEVGPGITVSVSSYRPTPVKVSGRQLLVNETPFTVKGVVYSPVPIGEDPHDAPYGDYFTSDRGAIADRDLPLLRGMGANTLRLYHWNPGADHSAFLDKAYNGGTNPLYVIAGYWVNSGQNIDDPEVRGAIKQQFRQMVAGHKNHPAILMWSIGSDLNAEGAYGDKLPQLFSLIDEMAAEAKAEEGASAHPVTTALKDLDLINTISAYEPWVPNLDLWGANVYRGSSFGTLFRYFKSASSKPLLITEYGIDAYDNSSNQEYERGASPQQADYAEKLWKEIAANSNVCIGGSVMSYSDEWWKGAYAPDRDCPPDTGPGLQGTCGYVSRAHPDGYANEEWWGIVRLAGTADGLDQVAPRAAYYRLKSLWGPAALRVASPNGGENFRTRTFQTIRWTYSGNPGSLVRIELLRNGKAFSTLSRSTSLGNNGSGSFTWYVSSLIKTGEDYQIRVISLTDSRYMDVSDASFTITNR